ncbi:putative short-chain dehydrogenase/reductase 2 [Pseudomassariella vexata]|uniref:Short-chain dehydrogenase/reductase 3 n=1 Tax=Pseudomassariella vexata TaxID=1141098 RepID=A0A1Y2EIQ0_9PEZI|nr:putative short-chain dehydrogenase/reductase 2 [Pseudomassariella vexata]ORY71458.1 putative short-chain dehydrogenase/reductase 2 [Pseudomassariella vexata]
MALGNLHFPEIPSHLQRLITPPVVRNAAVVLAFWAMLRKLNMVLSNRALNNRTQNPPWDWRTEIAVVTGGCRGIGEDVVRKLAKCCINVIAIDLHPPEMPFPDNVIYYKADVTKTDEFRKAAEEIRRDIGHPTVLINNAGVGSYGNILERPEAEVRQTFNVNIISHFITVKEFLPSMVEKNHGHIVTVASMASFVSIANIIDYSCTKAAALAFHEGLAQELRHRYKAMNVRTSIIHPNWVRTPMIAELIEYKPNAERYLEPQDISDAIVKQVKSGKSGQIVMPSYYGFLSGIRGFPSWLQEGIRNSRAGLLETPKDWVASKEDAH